MVMDVLVTLCLGVFLLVCLQFAFSRALDVRTVAVSFFGHLPPNFIIIIAYCGYIYNRYGML